jgi:hypothetical protein
MQTVEYEFNSIRHRGEQSTLGAVWVGHSAGSDGQVQSEVDKLSRLNSAKAIKSTTYVTLRVH